MIKRVFTQALSEVFLNGLKGYTIEIKVIYIFIYILYK